MDRWLLRLQDFMGRPQRPALKIAVIVGTVALITAIRWLADRGANGFNFSPFLPIILISAVLLGWRYAVFAAVLSVFSVTQVFMEPDWQNRPLTSRLTMLLLFTVIIAIIVLVSEALRKLLFVSTLRAQQVQTYNDELQHRTSNMVQVLVNWIERGLLQDDPMVYFSQLSAHLIAWSRSNEMLRNTAQSAVDLRSLTAESLSPFPAAGTSIEGPPVRVEGNAARATAMAFHELATNSVKYGALAHDGTVRVGWTVDTGRALIEWAESGGAPARPAVGSGFGLRLLAAMDDIADLRIVQNDSGLTCRFTVRLAG